MKFGKAALVLVVTVSLITAPAETASAAPPKTTVTWHFSDSTVTAKAHTKVIYSVTAPAPGGTVILQRAYGTANVFRNLTTLAHPTSTKTINGALTVAAPARGRYLYRIVVLDKKAHSLRSATHYLYSYGNVSMLWVLPGNGGGTVAVGTGLYRYADEAGDGYDRGLDESTCRSVTISGAFSNSAEDEPGASAILSVLEERGDGGAMSIVPGRVSTKTVALAAGAFQLSLTSTAEYHNAFINATFSCYTASGQ